MPRQERNSAYIHAFAIEPRTHLDFSRKFHGTLRANLQSFARARRRLFCSPQQIIQSINYLKQRIGTPVQPGARHKPTKSSISEIVDGPGRIKLGAEDKMRVGSLAELAVDNVSPSGVGGMDGSGHPG